MDNSQWRIICKDHCAAVVRVLLVPVVTFGAACRLWRSKDRPKLHPAQTARHHRPSINNPSRLPPNPNRRNRQNGWHESRSLQGQISVPPSPVNRPLMLRSSACMSCSPSASCSTLAQTSTTASPSPDSGPSPKSAIGFLMIGRNSGRNMTRSLRGRR